MRSLFISFFSLFSLILLSQNDGVDEQLARSNFELRDYEKAEIYLLRLFPKNPEKYYNMLLKSSLALKKNEQALDIVKQVLKKDKKNIQYIYDLGGIYFRLKDSLKAEDEWRRASEIAKKDDNDFNSLIQLFQTNRNWVHLENLLSGMSEKNGNLNYYKELLIDVYLLNKKYTQAVDLIIEKIEKDDQTYMNTLMRIQNSIEEIELVSQIQKKIYGKYSQNQNSEKWTQMAMWLSQATKDYEESLRIGKSYDKRTNGNGAYVLSISDVAFHDEQYSVALDGYRYISNILTNNAMAKLGLEREIGAYYLMLKSNPLDQKKNLDSIQVRMDSYFNKYSLDHTTADMQILKGEIMVKYKNDIKGAIQLLERLLSFANLPKNERSRATLCLGDYKLIDDDIWEASLLFGQVDKEEKDSPLGEEARYKNSKIFYYNGDFELAAELLSILKSSTTELLANDALRLSVFIQDNLSDDTFNNAMREVAKSELFFYQNKSEEALTILEKIKTRFPGTSLIDDVLMIEAEEAMKQGKWNLAETRYLEVIEKHGGSILADKAIYEISKLYEIVFHTNQKAIDGYLKLLTKYKDSVYTADARKRLRKLRGEKDPES